METSDTPILPPHVIKRMFEESEAQKTPTPTLHRTLAAIGMNTPIDRLVGGTLVTAGAMWALKPGFAFTDRGSARRFGAGADATYATWYTTSFAVGVAMSQLL